MTPYALEIIAFSIIAIIIVVLRLWISRQQDIPSVRRRIRDIGLWVVSIGALLLSVLFPALRPTSPVGFFVAFGAIYLLASRQRDSVAEAKK